MRLWTPLGEGFDSTVMNLITVGGISRFYGVVTTGERVLLLFDCFKCENPKSCWSIWKICWKSCRLKGRVHESKIPYEGLTVNMVKVYQNNFIEDSSPNKSSYANWEIIESGTRAYSNNIY